MADESQGKPAIPVFLPLMLLIFMLMNFNPLIKLLLFVPQGEDLSFFSFDRGTNLFSVSKFTCSPKKESKKLKNSHFGQIHEQFELFTVSYWVSWQGLCCLDIGFRPWLCIFRFIHVGEKGENSEMVLLVNLYPVYIISRGQDIIIVIY